VSTFMQIKWTSFRRSRSKGTYLVNGTVKSDLNSINLLHVKTVYKVGRIGKNFLLHAIKLYRYSVFTYLDTIEIFDTYII